MPRRRLGVALLVPRPFDREVDALRRALGDRSLPRMPPHVTLVPPVNVRENRLDDALAVLRRAGAAGSPLTLTLGPPATFGPTSPVVHLEVGGEPAAMAAVRALRDSVFMPPLERALTWPFVPHVTLSDGVTTARIESAVAALADYVVEATFDRVHLLEEREGRVWAPVAEARLEAPAVVGRGGLELELSTLAGLAPDEAAFVDLECRSAETGEGAGWPHPEPLIVTGRRGGRLVGVARGWVKGEDAHLGELVVTRCERGTGVGTQLLAAFEARAAGAGCRRATVLVEAATRGEAFYRGRGWVEEMALPGWRAGSDFLRLVRVL